MTNKIDTSRRHFLRKSVVLTAASAVGAPFALDLFKMNQAAAITGGLTDYKALVCIYLAGGNDHNNMVLATDTDSWNGYLKARDTRDSNGGGSIALVLPNTYSPNVLPISHTYNAVLNKTGFSNSTRAFGLHPAMAPMQTLFNTDKKAAIIANVGPLTERLANVSEYRSGLKTKPSNLFSHSDQTAQWQTSQSSPSYGWGGRVAQQVIGNNSKTNFTCISASGNTIFLAGQGVNQYQINSNGTATAIQGINNSSLFGVTVDNNIASPTYGSPFKQFITPTATNYFETDHAAVVQRAITARKDLTDAIAATTGVAAAPITGAGAYVNPLTGLTGETNPLATQLRTVARLVSQQSLLGANRQIFFVTLGGFDTHDLQTNSHAVLMARLSHGMAYFHNTLKTLSTDMSSMVTTFTASDFGRTFASNGDGTDHGWGAHHFVVGGAVNGGDVYGDFPMTAATGASRTVNGVLYPAYTNTLDVGSGNLVPQISVDQYAATMAKWFGLSSGDISTVFPNLGSFSTPDLGFML